MSAREVLWRGTLTACSRYATAQPDLTAPSADGVELRTRMMEVAVFTAARILPMPSAATGYAALLSSAGPRMSAVGWKGFAAALRACSTASAMAAITCDATCFAMV